MGKLPLNSTPSELLVMVKELPYFDDTIELDVLLARSVRLDVYDPINCLLFNAFNIDLLRGQVLCHV